LINDPETLKSWLAHQQRGTVLMLAFRSASRILPLYGAEMERGWAECLNLSALPVLRCLLAARVSLNSTVYKLHMAANAAAEHAKIHKDNTIYTAPISSLLSAHNLAIAAAHGEQAQAKRIDAAILSITQTITGALDRKGEEEEMWQAIHDDVMALEHGKALTNRALWHGKTPDWFSEHDAEMERIWAKKPESWSFFQRWWLDIKRGEFLEQKVHRKIIFIPEKCWESGPESVAHEIKAISPLQDNVNSINTTVGNDKEGGKVETVALVDRVVKNRVSIFYASKLIINLIENLREQIRGDNKISSDERVAALKTLDKLYELSREAQEMSEVSSDVPMENEDVQSWTKRFKSAIEESMSTILDPKNVANATVPTGLILGCGALGALIGGPIGFGAGSMLGHLITGQIKPGAAAKTIEGAVSKDD